MKFVSGVSKDGLYELTDVKTGKVQKGVSLLRLSDMALSERIKGFKHTKFTGKPNEVQVVTLEDIVKSWCSKSKLAWWADLSPCVQIEDGHKVILKTVGAYFTACSKLAGGLVRFPIPAFAYECGVCCFAGCNWLAECLLPENGALTRIESCAFANCHELVKVVVNNSIEYIAEDAFLGSPKVTLFYDGDIAPDWLRDYCERHEIGLSRPI